MVYDLMLQEELSGGAAEVPCTLAWLTASRRLRRLAPPTAEAASPPLQEDDEVCDIYILLIYLLHCLNDMVLY